MPAPCMYAHKIADLFTRIGYSRKAKSVSGINRAEGGDVIARSERADFAKVGDS